APMSLAAISAGAHGLIVEVHSDPDSALCDGSQTITPEELARIAAGTAAIRSALAPGMVAVWASRGTVD
ncbi:MAG: hypothetical protein M3Y37_07505, partial [Chloroflexota bacterium]|nr:hypothetical protein [Chloroflexota bacterium]